MADSSDWLAFARPFYQALTAAATAGGAVTLKWAWDWWQKRKDDAVSEEDRREKARRADIERLDAKQRAEFDRLYARVEKLEAENDQMDEEIHAWRRHVWNLEGLIRSARQKADSTARTAKLTVTQWPDIPDHP
jgi:hypothetical protein